jgi:hypothetical protein
MSARARETAAALAFLALFLGAAWLTLDFGPRARMIPLPLALFGALLALVQLILNARGIAPGLHMDLIRVQPPAATPEGDDGDGSWRPDPQASSPGATPLQAYAIVGGLLVMILAIGPVPSVFLFTLAYFFRSGYCSLPIAFCWAAAFSGIVYLLFFVALQIQPYHGVLAPLLPL